MEITGAHVDCHLASHTYVFGIEGYPPLTPYYALMSMLRQCPGENAWRLRGSIATDAYAAIQVSRPVGASTIPFLAGFGGAHAVCFVMRLSRDKDGHVTEVHLVGRNSYGHSSEDAALHAALTRELFDETEAMVREHPHVRGSTRVTSRWHEAGDWQTQAGDGSCTAQALMVALRIAQDEVAGGTSFFDRRLGELCPVEYAVVCAEALRISPRPEETNLAFRVPERESESQRGHVTYGVVRCDGSVLCCCVLADSATGAESQAHVREAVRAAELALQRSAEQKRGALQASFRAEDWGGLWPVISAAARGAGYTLTRRAASKVYRPEDTMV
jgi:hypothetical protein